MAEVEVIMGDSRDVLKTLGDCSIDSVVCDPPYALVSITKRFGKPGSKPAKGDVYQRAASGFMSQTWDTGETAFAVEFWAEVMRVLKPGGHVVAFSGTRTYHRLACAVEDAGFEIRDMLSWLYGSGFPKSHDVSKGIDKARDDKPDIHRVAAFVAAGRDAAGFTNRMIDEQFGFNGMAGHWTNSRGPQAQVPKWEQWLRLKSLCGFGDEMDAEVWRLNGRKGTPGDAWGDREFYDEPTGGLHGGSGNTVGAFTKGRQAKPGGATEAGRQWEGWGTALKPACEPIVFARKPLGTCGVNVVDVVEFGLRNQGVEGEIRWTSEPANGAAKIASRRTSSSTVQPPAGETSAAPVGGSETGNGERPTARSSALTGGSGATPTLAEAGSTAEPLTPSSAPKSSPHTAVTANVAESKSKPSSPSITSTAAEPNTGGAFTAKSTPSCDASDSPATDTGCFAGIATGLTGSLAHVHISRNLDGSFVWPKGLPKRLDPQPLTVAANVLAHGTGALNIEGCRVGWPDGVAPEIGTPGWGGPSKALTAVPGQVGITVERSAPSQQGRWPANVLHDGSEDVVSSFPVTGAASGRPRNNGDHQSVAKGAETAHVTFGHDDDGGSAARFFYSAKADQEDRLGSKHPTVKPVDLMAWLCRLVTPPGGLILDPFAGSGSTGLGAMREGFDCILIEREAEYVADIRRRVAWAQGEGRLTVLEKARDLSPSDAAGNDLPLFATQETAQPASQPASASSTAASPATPHRPNGDDEMVAA